MRLEKIAVLTGLEKLDGSWELQPRLCVVQFSETAWIYGAAFDEFGEVLFHNAFGLATSSTAVTGLTELRTGEDRWFMPFEDQRQISELAQHFITAIGASSEHQFASKLNHLGIPEVASATIDDIEFDTSRFKSCCIAVTKSSEIGDPRVDDFVDLILFNNRSERFGIEHLPE